MQPEADATSGSYRGGGWGRVLGWCKKYSSGGLETFFNPIEEDDAPCDLILIQLDGDAMEHCAAHSDIALPEEPCSAADRVMTLKGMAVGWLTVPALRQEQVRFAFPVMHSEAWLLAGLLPNAQNWENLPDAKTPFRALKPSMPRRSLAKFYQDKAKEAASNSGVIPAQSVSFSLFKAGLV